MRVLKFPNAPQTDIPGALRQLAAEIERGDFGDVSALVWVCHSKRDGEDVSIGALGRLPDPAPGAYLLLGLAQRKIERANHGT